MSVSSNVSSQGGHLYSGLTNLPKLMAMRLLWPQRMTRKMISNLNGARLHNASARQMELLVLTNAGGHHDFEFV